MAIILDHVKILQALEALGLEFEPVSGVITYGEANDGANVGAGTGRVYRDKTGVTLNFRTLIEDPANPGITITTEGDTIKFGTVAGTGNVVGTPPSVADGVATYDGTTGLLISGPDTKFKTVSEELSETPPLDKDVQYMEMRTSEGSDWAEIIRYGISAVGSFDNNIRIGPEEEFNGQANTLSLFASEDPIVTIIGETFGKMIHEGMQEAWEIRREGKISQEVGANTPILTLKNGGSGFTEVVFKAGSVLPNGVVDGKNGDRYYFKDQSDASNTTEYVFRNLTPGNNSWEVAGGGGVTDHGALTGLGDDDHAQYALLAGRSGGQKITGGTGDSDDLRFVSTSGNGTAGGSEISFKVGVDGSITSLVIASDGNAGFGTPSPSEKLSVVGRIEVSEGSDTYVKIGGRVTKAVYDAMGTNCKIVNTRSGDTYPFDTFGNMVIGSRAGVGDIVLSTSSTDYGQFILDTSGDLTLGGDVTLTDGATIDSTANGDIEIAPNGTGSLVYTDGFEGIGRVMTSNDTTGSVKWLPPNPVFERTTSSNYTATVLNRTIICYEEITVTLPITGIEDGHIFEIKNALGVNYGSGATGDVTLSISGGSNYFDGSTTVSSLTLADDGWVTKVQWSSSISGYWVLKHQFVKTTGTAA